ncbi:hypothetical protein TNCV_1847041 [Trichonephila clavipes]|nr:hypothetical protein TNCV_1847041 [Trichonephila clavipes]
MSLKGDESTSTPSLSQEDRCHLKKERKTDRILSFHIVLSIQRTLGLLFLLFKLCNHLSSGRKREKSTETVQVASSERKQEALVEQGCPVRTSVLLSSRMLGCKEDFKEF